VQHIVEKLSTKATTLLQTSFQFEEINVHQIIHFNLCSKFQEIEQNIHITHTHIGVALRVYFLYIIGILRISLYLLELIGVHNFLSLPKPRSYMIIDRNFHSFICHVNVYKDVRKPPLALSITQTSMQVLIILPMSHNMPIIL
jgi:hypothetical protein